MESETYPNPCEEKNGPAKLSEPKKIGFYSIGPQQDYLNDFSQLKYINSTYEGVPVKFDLNHKIHLAEKHASIDTKLKFMQYFLKHNRDYLNVLDSSEISLDEVPFVGNQGVFRKLSCTPYKQKSPYRVAGCLFRGVLYISRLWPSDSPSLTNNKSPSSSWGHKFEQYMLSDDPTKEPDTESPVDENSYFACVFEAHLNKHRLIYSGQMSGLIAEGTSLEQGFRPDKHSNQHVLEEIKKLSFAKLNTNTSTINDYQENVFRTSKTLNWWLQATFIGVKTILCGVRNDKLGIVEKVLHYKTDELPEGNEDFWVPDRCMNFFDRFLKFVKKSFYEEICLKHPGSGDNVRHLPMILLAFEIRPKEVFTPSEFVLTQPSPNEDLHILWPEFMEVFTE